MIHRVLNKRSNRSQIFFKIGVLKNFANFTGKHLFDSLFNEVAFATFLRTPLEHLSWLLLKYITVLLEKYKYSVKKVFLKTSQYSQEKISVGVSFLIKSQAFWPSGLQIY